MNESENITLILEKENGEKVVAPVENFTVRSGIQSYSSDEKLVETFKDIKITLSGTIVKYE